VTEAALRLKDWDSFYVIVGSSAGALTGLMFVVMALTQNLRTPAASQGVRSFASPTIVHFTTVLSISAILSMPRHTHTTLGICVLAIGIGLLSYVAWLIRRTRDGVGSYSPDRSDWMWHFVLPSVAYLALIVAGASVWASASRALDVVAGSVLLLLIIGIHNAWDSAVYMIITRPQDS
jgi:hypothetical protein